MGKIDKPRLLPVSHDLKSGYAIKSVEKHQLDTPFHFHNMCELVYIEESSGKRIVGDRVDFYEPDHLVLMGPNLPHIWINETAPAKAMVIYFEVDYLLGLSDDIDVKGPIEKLLNNSSRGLIINGQVKNRVKEQMKMLSQETGLKGLIIFLEIIKNISESPDFQFMIEMDFNNNLSKDDTDRFNVIYQYLLNNYQNDISLNVVAGIANMTPQSFCRYFKARTKKTFVEFLNELRIGQACRLLLQDTLTITDVCYQSGYNNLTNFYKAFNKVRGETPKEYRSKIKK